MSFIIASEQLRSSGPPEFTDLDLEEKYRVTVARRGADSIATIFRRVAIAHFFILLGMVAITVTGRYYFKWEMYVLISLLVLSLGLAAKAVTDPRFISDPWFAEIIVSAVIAFTASALILALLSGAYGNEEYLACDDQAHNHVNDIKKSRIEFLSSFLGLIIPYAGVALMHSNVVHYKAFRRTMGILVGCHALRSLVLTPVEGPLLWSMIYYALTPYVLLQSANAKERDSRKLFLLDLKLKSDLVAAEKALRYEAPTNAEKQLVQRVVKDDNATLRDLELSFESLELFETLGGGAFGEVIKGKYAGTTLVAVKRLRRSQMNEECLRMLLMEATLLRDMRHPNIVQLVGVSWDSAANVCVVMEYMERGSLRQALDDKQISLSWSDPLLKMIIGVASGLLYMHTRPKPVIHRDVKPDNVLVTSTYGCKLTDLGASRRVEHLDSATMTQIGTTMYIAPEVMIGQRYNMSVDIYAVGIMLVAMHTRKKPFPDGHAGGMGLVLNGLRPIIPEDMPAGLSSLAQDCWQRDPELRPGCADVLARLKRVEEYGEGMFDSLTGSDQQSFAGQRRVSVLPGGGGGVVVVGASNAASDAIAATVGDSRPQADGACGPLSVQSKTSLIGAPQ